MNSMDEFFLQKKNKGRDIAIKLNLLTRKC